METRSFATYGNRTMIRGSLSLMICSALRVAACSDHSRNQSPFELRGLRAGMRVSTLNRLSQPGSAWQCHQFSRSAVGLRRTVGTANKNFSGGLLIAMVDTVGQRVLQLHYSLSPLATDPSNQAAFEREMAALALKWDKMPAVIRHPARENEPPRFSAWDSGDSLWTARIYYTQGGAGPSRPDALEIEEHAWSEHLMKRLATSLKAEPPRTEWEYVGNDRNAACAALLQSL